MTPVHLEFNGWIICGEATSNGATAHRDEHIVPRTLEVVSFPVSGTIGPRGSHQMWLEPRKR
jgi:hypothetical protein